MVVVGRLVCCFVTSSLRASHHESDCGVEEVDEARTNDFGGTTASIPHHDGLTCFNRAFSAFYSSLVVSSAKLDAFL